ncbi:MAG TPA: NHL repeat-containing protein [Candidatus Methylomirabilis sp.]|nr:NHL repeat-containing protein [Candidatus Methylomirabilis sp.]
MKRCLKQEDRGRIKAEIALIACLLALLLLYASLASAAPNGPSSPAQVVTTTFKPVRLVYHQAEGETFRKPTGVFVDRVTGDVVVTDSGKDLVTVLSPEGVPLFAVGYNREVPQPSQAVVDGRGRLLVLAGVPRKVKGFTYRGEPLGDFNYPGLAEAAQVVPTAMTVDEAGNLYIADGTSGRILVYSPEDRLLRTIGKRGQEPGTFSSVTAITVDQAGTVYVADAQHKPAIQVFDAQGIYVRGWGEHSGGPQNVSLPSGIAVDSAGRILVVDTIRQSILVFTREGGYLFRFGGLGTWPGALAFPTGLDVDPAGRLYVTESLNARLQVFELNDAGSAPKGRALPTPEAPSPVREEIRRGMGEFLKGIQK